MVAIPEMIKDLIEILGNVGTAFALFWIIGGYIQQGKQLNLQREELGLQRQALQQQVDELKKAHKLSLDQEIARMLSDAHNSLMSGWWIGGFIANFYGRHTESRTQNRL